MPLNPPLTQWAHKIVWLVGASSGIGQATAALLHTQGAKVVVSARNAQALQQFADTHPSSMALVVDATDPDALCAAAGQIIAAHGHIDLVIYCAGHYEAMRANHFDLNSALKHQQINYVGALHLLHAVLPIVRQQGHGHLSFVSSVAGYRGLPNALAYGPTKAALTHLVQALYLDLHPLGIGCSVIHPGFVATGLTANNTFKMPALISPEQAAQAILKGWGKGQFDIHFPKRFTLWLKLLRHLSDGLYFKLIRSSTGL
jgi:NADP-dependent 3-hydroxy acid dehydrogenase YdfG